MSKSSLTDLAGEYEQQYNVINARIEGLRPLLRVYTGEELLDLRRRIKTYYDMAIQCKVISKTLENYYEDDCFDEKLN